MYGTRGNSGGNAAGPGAVQGSRRTSAKWRRDTPSPRMESLTLGSCMALTPRRRTSFTRLRAWGHGQALGGVVRLFRITRPEVILTWMPNYVVGENHDDHQAAGVIATEAFDLAGQSAGFSGTGRSRRDRLSINNYGEGLRTWHPKKITTSPTQPILIF